MIFTKFTLLLGDIFGLLWHLWHFWYFKMWSLIAWRGIIALFALSPACIFKSILKLPAREDTNSNWFHFLRCAFSNVSSTGLPEKRHSRIGCICLTFLHCAFSNVSSNGLHGKRNSHIGCICLTFLRCVFFHLHL